MLYGLRSGVCLGPRSPTSLLPLLPRTPYTCISPGMFISIDAGEVEGAVDPKTGKNITVGGADKLPKATDASDAEPTVGARTHQAHGRAGRRAGRRAGSRQAGRRAGSGKRDA